MQMKLPKIKDPRFFWGSLVTMFGAIVVTFYEYKLVEPSLLNPYLISKTLIILAIVVVCTGLIFNSTKMSWQNAYAFTAYAYVIQGDFFRPNYLYAYLMFLFAQALFFNQSRRLFLSIHIPMTFLFTLSLYHNFEINKVRLAQHNNFIDYISMILTSFVVGVFIFTQINKARHEIDKFNSRFLLVGKQASNIIHDLKSLATAPQIYLDLLLVSASHMDPRTKEILELLKGDLENMVIKTRKLYEMIQSKQTDQTLLDPMDAISNCQRFLSGRLEKIKFAINDARVEQEKMNFPASATELILLNLLYNSLEAFKSHNIFNPKVFIAIVDDKISYIDNAGGAPETVIDDFNKKKLEASGLGLFLIRDAAEANNLNVQIKNSLTVDGELGLSVTVIRN